MYIRPQHREERVDVLHEAIEKIRFGTLITVGAEGPLATHIPMFVNATPQPNGLIFGHIARQNGQWKNSQPGKLALATFVGPHAYISPSSYETKKLTGKVVPTWMYLAIHAMGPIEFFEDNSRLRAIVEESTRRQERNRSAPWAVADAPAEYVQSQLRGIIGFEFGIETLQGSWKLSQKKSDADREGVALTLAAEGQRRLSALVRDNI